MAVLKGEGAFTGVNLLAKVYDNGVTKDGKTAFADVQIDARDSRGPGQSNLHLVSKVREVDGKPRHENDAAYSTEQIAAIAAAAGDNWQPVLNKDNEPVGKLYAVKANVMPASRGTGLVVNTKTLGASEFTVDDKTLTSQFESMKAAKAARAASAEQSAETEKVAEAEAEAPAMG